MSVLNPIAGTSLANEAFGKLVEAITSGEFEPGEKLSEADLARKLGISRGPLREALGRLEGRLVTRTPRLGVRVIQFSKDDLEHLFLVREALEGMAARLAAEVITDSELRSLGDLLRQHANRPALAAGQAYRQHSHDDDFHFAIVHASRSERIERLLLDEVYYQLRIHRLRSSTRPGRAKAAWHEHAAILAAMEQRDPDGAEIAMRRHIRNARLSATAALDGEGRPNQ
ncbi:GntR family transcriptional regulator [Alsobacter soli]|uniref:GntR family transcriptional regulator n=1 Tax=Alsobacter soli TaxID=2109933 RepID=A0A2T1HV09_9HYPH|nr:GntR family transcriptional regulator [Alsobacter soli]PSC05458.1 GntR family transcriptional regulator [Alsobacter soli]